MQADRENQIAKAYKRKEEAEKTRKRKEKLLISLKLICFNI